MIEKRGIDRELEWIGEGIGEEKIVGEGDLKKKEEKILMRGNLIEIGKVKEILGMSIKGIEKMRMGMEKRIERNKGWKIDIKIEIIGNKKDEL